MASPSKGDKAKVMGTVTAAMDGAHYTVDWGGNGMCVVPEGAVTGLDPDEGTGNLAAAASGPKHKVGDRVKATKHAGHARKGDEGKVTAVHNGPHYLVSISSSSPGTYATGSDVHKYDPDKDNDTDTSGQPDTDALMRPTDVMDALMSRRRR